MRFLRLRNLSVSWLCALGRRQEADQILFIDIFLAVCQSDKRLIAEFKVLFTEFVSQLGIAAGQRLASGGLSQNHTRTRRAPRLRSHDLVTKLIAHHAFRVNSAPMRTTIISPNRFLYFR